MGKTTTSIFSIEGGRSSFWQWDVNQRIAIDDISCREVHFCNSASERALPCPVYEEGGKRFANVPNILLQTAGTIRAYAYITDDKGKYIKYTKHTAHFAVSRRPQPADYIYTETDLYTVEEKLEEALQTAKDSGDFKGDKGDKGDAGSIKFQVVTELPTEVIDESAIYLVPNADPKEQNTYDEYIYTNGAWECIGSASVEVNLDEYVKKTDYASVTKAGVVKVSKGDGISINANGLISIVPANAVQIQNKEGMYYPITPLTLDYAIKAGMSTNALEWTEEEKQSARDLIGAASNANTPISGDVEKAELIVDITTTEEVDNIQISKDLNGNAFSVKAVEFLVDIPSSAARDTVMFNFTFSDIGAAKVGVCMATTTSITTYGRLFAPVAIPKEEKTPTMFFASNSTGYMATSTFNSSYVEKFFVAPQTSGNKLPIGTRVRLWGVRK